MPAECLFARCTYLWARDDFWQQTKCTNFWSSVLCKQSNEYCAMWWSVSRGALWLWCIWQQTQKRECRVHRVTRTLTWRWVFWMQVRIVCTFLYTVRYKILPTIDYTAKTRLFVPIAAMSWPDKCAQNVYSIGIRSLLTMYNSLFATAFTYNTATKLWMGNVLL